MTCDRCAGLMFRDEERDFQCLRCGGVKVVNAWKPTLVPAAFKHYGTKRGPTRTMRNGG